MFARKKSKSLWSYIKEFFWPAMGLKRTIKYFWHRLVRLSDSSPRIALGLAIGSAVSFSPLLGTHFLQALLFAHFAKANYIAALIGTFWGNPWSFPFIWFAGYQLGSFIFSLFGMQRFSELPTDLDFTQLWDIIIEKPLTLFLPWMLGGYLCGIIFLPFAFAGYYYIVNLAQKARKKKYLARLNAKRKEHREVTLKKKSKITDKQNKKRVR